MREKTTCFCIAVNICMLSAGVRRHMLSSPQLRCPAVNIVISIQHLPCCKGRVLFLVLKLGHSSTPHPHPPSLHSFKTQLSKHEPCTRSASLLYLVGILDDLHVIYSKLVCIKFHQPLRDLRQAS